MVYWDSSLEEYANASKPREKTKTNVVLNPHPQFAEQQMEEGYGGATDNKQAASFTRNPHPEIAEQQLQEGVDSGEGRSLGKSSFAPKCG